MQRIEHEELAAVIAREVAPTVSAASLERAAISLTAGDPARQLRLDAEGASSAARAHAHAGAPDVAACETCCDAAKDAAFLSVLADLVAQGWGVSVSPPTVTLEPPRALAGGGEPASQAKARIRRAHGALRAEALADPATREFVRSMETRRPFNTRRVSVLDLVDDGAALAQELKACALAPLEKRAALISDSVSPYIVPVTPGARCPTTGIELTDVWRYFRLTWAFAHRSTPGRTFAFLVRNRARQGDPVIGIGALASPVAQLSRRDAWVGWTLPSLKQRLSADPDGWAEELASLKRSVATALRDVRMDDLLQEAKAGAGAVEEELLAISRRAAAARLAKLQPLKETNGVRGDAPLMDLGTRPAASKALPRNVAGDIDWIAASEDLLFKRKRAQVGAELLFAERVMARAPAIGGDALALIEGDAEFARAVSIGVRECRKAGLASRVLDLSICGAVPPYGALLGGKLVALSVAARELRTAYQRRYADQVSEISSQMAGRAVRRPADYCAATTTSLYGAASSQYNRLSVDVSDGGPAGAVRWRDLGLSVGYGTVHLSKRTLALLTEATRARYGGQNVTYRFGEGNSASMRQAREGLELLMPAPNDVLRHEYYRRVYGLALSERALEALRLNKEHSVESPCFDAIAAAWTRRWLVRRVELGEVLARVESEGPTSVRARVAAQEDAQDAQLGLFTAPAARNRA
jgi:hypothetical protein